MTVVREGESTWPPPPVSVSAAPVAAPAAVAAVGEPGKDVKQHMSPARRFGIVATAAAVLFGVTALSPPALIGHLVVFALAIVIGYYVIGHVHHALHTPLMSVTNAISGIIVVGALLQIGQHDLRSRSCPPWRSCWPRSTSSAVSPSPGGCSPCSQDRS